MMGERTVAQEALFYSFAVCSDHPGEWVIRGQDSFRHRDEIMPLAQGSAVYR